MSSQQHVIKLNAHKLVRQLTVQVKVTGYTSWQWRKRLGVLLMKLGARIIGTGFEVVD